MPDLNPIPSRADLSPSIREGEYSACDIVDSPPPGCYWAEAHARDDASFEGGALNYTDLTVTGHGDTPEAARASAVAAWNALFPASGATAREAVMRQALEACAAYFATRDKTVDWRVPITDLYAALDSARAKTEAALSLTSPAAAPEPSTLDA